MHITIPHEMYRQLIDHLFTDSTEQLAFLLAVPTDRQPLTLRVDALHCVPPEGFLIQTPYHLSLKDETRATMTKWAWDHGASLIEAHSHLGDLDAAFSPTDLTGLREFVPHIWWRLQGRPYAALVFTKVDFDALVWTKSPEVAHSLAALRVEGVHDRQPTSHTINWMMRHNK